MNKRESIIKDFKQDHRIILILLLKCKETTFSNEQRTNFLHSAKSILVDHLQKEDKLLYPVLMESSNEQSTYKSTAEEFISSMTKISSIIMSFINRQEKSGTFDSALFDSDFPKIKKLLEIRIQKEESILYPAFITEGQ